MTKRNKLNRAVPPSRPPQASSPAQPAIQSTRSPRSNRASPRWHENIIDPSELPVTSPRRDTQRRQVRHLMDTEINNETIVHVYRDSNNTIICNPPEEQSTRDTLKDLRRRIRHLPLQGHKCPRMTDAATLGLELKRHLASKAPVLQETYDVAGRCVVRRIFPEVRQLPVFDINDEQDCTLNGQVTVLRTSE